MKSFLTNIRYGTKKAVSLILAVAMALTVITAGTLNKPEQAQAAAMNQGNPYTNGDLILASGWGTSDGGTYYMLNLGTVPAHIADHQLDPNGAPDFAMPVDTLSRWSGLPTSMMEWGVSEFFVALDGTPSNPNNINYTIPKDSNGYINMHCIEHGLDTAQTGLQSTVTPGLMLSMSYNASTGIYTGTFIAAFAGQSGQQSSASIVPFTVTWQNSGWAKLVKTSANTSITNGNSCYSLAGATYGIYSSQSDANSGSNRVDLLTTDSTGSTDQSDSLVPGTYYVKEVSPATGYLLDDTVYPITVTAGQTTTLNVKDAPGNDPVAAYVYKLDSETGDQDPQGGASLAGAQFTVKYYDGYYNTAAAATASGAPTRTWVFATGEDGAFVLNNLFYISGDPLYLSTNGSTTLPLGTYVYSETKASEGYLLPDNPTVFVTRIVTDLDNVDFGYQVEGDIFGAQPQVGNSTTKQNEQIIRGDMEIAKINNASDNSVETPLGGIQFTITSVTTGEVFTITTNASGFATTRDLIPAGSNMVGALPYDTYIVHEVESSVPTGLNLVPDFTTTISTNRQMNQYILNDDQINAALQVVKKDVTTGNTITASGMTFEILDADKNTMSFTVHSPKEATVTQFTTDEDGQIVLPERLDFGLYYLREITAPIGYNKVDDVAFSVTEERSFLNPIVITSEDPPQMAQLKLTKLDKVSQEPMAHAIYGLYAAEDIVTGDGTQRAAKDELVDTLTITDPAGTTSKEVFVGKYYLKELAAPVGYLQDKSVYDIDLSYEATATLVQKEQTVEDDYTKIQIRKTDLVTGEEIPGADLTLTSDLTGSIVATWTTDGNPKEFDHLEPGGYTLTETAAPDGYLISESVPIAVNATGDIQKFEMKDDYTKVTVTKTDMVTGMEIPGAKLEVIPSGETSAVASWESSTTAHQIDRLAPGDYILRETMAPDGYLLSRDVTFTVDATGAIQQVEMKDDYTKVQLSKVDLASGKELPGAKLQLTDADGSIVATWTSGDTPKEIDKLDAGDYTLTETAAPEGYEIAESVTFKVDAIGDIQKVVMEDCPVTLSTPPAAMPKTGDRMTRIWLSALVVAVIALGFIIMLDVRRKKLLAPAKE